MKTDSEIREVFARAYKICNRAYELNEEIERKRDFNQRIDEMSLIYSQIFEMSVNEAKKDLEEESKKLIAEEIEYEP